MNILNLQSEGFALALYPGVGVALTPQSESLKSNPTTPRICPSFPTTCTVALASNPLNTTANTSDVPSPKLSKSHFKLDYTKLIRKTKGDITHIMLACLGGAISVGGCAVVVFITRQQIKGEAVVGGG